MWYSFETQGSRTDMETITQVGSLPQRKAPTLTQTSIDYPASMSLRACHFRYRYSSQAIVLRTTRCAVCVPAETQTLPSRIAGLRPVTLAGPTVALKAGEANKVERLPEQVSGRGCGSNRRVVEPR